MTHLLLQRLERLGLVLDGRLALQVQRRVVLRGAGGQSLAELRFGGGDSGGQLVGGGGARRGGVVRSLLVGPGR